MWGWGPLLLFQIQARKRSRDSDLGTDLFWWGKGLPHVKAWGPTNLVWPSKPRGKTYVLAGYPLEEGKRPPPHTFSRTKKMARVTKGRSRPHRTPRCFATRPLPVYLTIWPLFIFQTKSKFKRSLGKVLLRTWKSQTSFYRHPQTSLPH